MKLYFIYFSIIDTYIEFFLTFTNDFIIQEPESIKGTFFSIKYFSLNT